MPPKKQSSHLKKIKESKAQNFKNDLDVNSGDEIALAVIILSKTEGKIELKSSSKVLSYQTSSFNSLSDDNSSSESIIVSESSPLFTSRSFLKFCALDSFIFFK